MEKNATAQGATVDGTTTRLPLALTLLICLLAGLLILCSVIGNLMVCFAIVVVRKLRKQAGNYQLVSLAVADCLVSVVVMPPAVYYLVEGRWSLGDLLCRLWTSADVTLCTASILNLCAISVDRYYVVADPLSYGAAKRTPGRMLLYVLLVWIGALLISAAPLLFAFQTDQPIGVCQVTQSLWYQIYATMGSFYVPTAIMLFVNYKIFSMSGLNQARQHCTALDRAARRLTRLDQSMSESVAANYNCSRSASAHDAELEAVTGRLSRSKGRRSMLQLTLSLSRRGQQQQRLRARQHSVSPNHGGGEGETKALKTLSMIMGAYICCWLPFFLLALGKSLCRYVCLTSSGSEAECCRVPVWLDWLVLWLGYVNSLLNPLIYAKYNRDFRLPFREMLCCRFRTLQTVLRHDMYAHQFGPSPSVLKLRRSTTNNANAEPPISES